MRVFSQGILCPPEGLTVREQARWWAGEPEMLMVALANDDISPDVMSEIARVAKQNDLAFKVANRKKVDGLTNDDRDEIFSMLTDGGECPVPRQGPPSKALTDLRFAYDIREVTEQAQRRKLLREAILKEFAVSDEAVNKRIQRIEKLWQSLIHIDSDLIGSLLQASQPDDTLTYEDIHWLLSGLHGIYASNVPPDDSVNKHTP